MSEESCFIENRRTPSIREYKQNKNGVLKTSASLELTAEDLRKIENIKNEIPEIVKQLRQKLENIGLSQEIIEKILKRKYIVIGKSFEGKILYGTGESFKIDNEIVIVTAGHLVGFSEHATGTFEGDIVALYDFQGTEHIPTSSYTSRENDVGFISIVDKNPSYYDIDRDFTSGDFTIDTGISSAIGSGIKEHHKEYSGFFYNIILENITKIPDNGTIVNNIVDSGDSGSVVIDEKSNPYCIVQTKIPNYIVAYGTVCETMKGVRKAFRDYKLLVLEENCSIIQE